MDKKVVIIGAGEIGRAIEKVLRTKNLNIVLWDKDSSKVRGQKSLAEIVPSANFLFLCVPSWALRETIKGIAGYINKKTVIISLTKGLEGRTLKTPDELLKETLPRGQKFVLLSGPMIAEELMSGKEGRGVVASSYKEAAIKVKKLFERTSVFVDYCSDARGAALASVLKNIYAVALGISDGLDLGINVKAWLTAESLKEMTEIAEILGGRKKTIMGSAGLGDLIATGFSNYSRNRQSGEDLIKIGHFSLGGEGAASITGISKLIGKQTKGFPLFNILSQILIYQKDAKAVFGRLLKMI